MSEIKNKLNTLRETTDNPLYKNMMRFLSKVDDIFHFDFGNIKNQKIYKDGFEKTIDLFTELDFLKTAHDHDGDVVFYNISDYNIRVFTIIENLEDKNVIDYLNIDKRAKRRLSKYENLINKLKEHSYVG